MDERLNLESMNCNDYASILSDQNFLRAMNFNESVTDRNLWSPDSGPSNRAPQSSFKEETDLLENSNFNDLVLKYINQLLMEEDVEEKYCMFQESAALQAAEKSFYNVLMVKDQVQVPDPDAESIASFDSKISMSGTALTCDVSESSFLPNNTSIKFDSHDSQYGFHPSYTSFSGTSSFADRFVDSPVSILSFPDTFCDNRLDDANRFVPNSRMLDSIATGISDQKMVKTEKKHENSFITDGSRGRKNSYSEDRVEDGRNSKQSAVYSEPTVRSKVFDDLLLCGGAKTHPSQCESVHNETANKGQSGQPKGSKGVKTRGKKKTEVVDLRSLLSLCAQSVSTNDQRGVSDLLKRIREHASPTGDGMQRLAHYFSIGLEARMAGSGTGIYKALLSRPTSAVDVLKSYHMLLGCFPFIKITYFVANKTIMRVAQNKSKLHIVDFGILYGFQWPSLIQRLSTRPGGPPVLRITGIDFPCPGFRPSQRVEETGRRLADYAETFGVRLEFKAIAQKWETIRIEDLELDDEETLVVNCAYRFRNLLDETVMVDSPRNKVLDLIRRMNPEIFIHGIVNGPYNGPFFLTRFKEALFFFSSMFDMLDATVGRSSEVRVLVERTVWGREAMNVIACESGERIERPDTYKQWQVRNQRAGFHQVAFDEEILKMAKKWPISDYHKDFVIDEDGYWMLQGWKGRVLYAISLWKPAY
ncbi:hypothetical protein SSX86_017280 [Deinandra increscens subsp. villosa]|uniref:GRAS family transcription factor n=1 Tax=Deinandra increscens subsp. villosa TaxID=3103831 RepID=A0AAP0CZL0_9ASTR